MALLAGTVITEIQGLLNDPTGSIYPQQALFPILNKAYRELQTKLTALGISVTKEVLSAIPLLAGSKVLDDGAGLPTDFLYPIELGERLLGSFDKYVPMEEREWEPDSKPQQGLGCWTFREESLKFPGATTDREILLRYFKSLGSLSDVNTPIMITESQTWLAQRSAALAALLIGVNPSRAEALITDLYGFNGAWEDFKAIHVKKQQSIPVRRRRTRWRVS